MVWENVPGAFSSADGEDFRAVLEANASEQSARMIAMRSATDNAKELVSALTAIGADVTFCNLQSTWGHDAFLLEVETMTQLIGDFLARIAKRFKIATPSTVTVDQWEI